jgi:hypothetical protein
MPDTPVYRVYSVYKHGFAEGFCMSKGLHTGLQGFTKLFTGGLTEREMTKRDQRMTGNKNRRGQTGPKSVQNRYEIGMVGMPTLTIRFFCLSFRRDRTGSSELESKVHFSER